MEANNECSVFPIVPDTSGFSSSHVEDLKELVSFFRFPVYADAAITGVSARSQAIRKRVVEVPRIVVRRRRPVRPIRRQQAEEEPERVVYQPVRVVQRELSPVPVVRQRQIRPVYRNERAAAVRGLQNGQRAAVIPVRQFIQQRSRQFPIRQNRVFSQQSAALKNGVLVERNFYGNRRQNPRASVIYVNEEMSSRIQPSARSRVRFIQKRPSRQFVTYRDDEVSERFPSTSASIASRGLKRKGRGFAVQYEY